MTSSPSPVRAASWRRRLLGKPALLIGSGIVVVSALAAVRMEAGWGSGKKAATTGLTESRASIVELLPSDLIPVVRQDLRRTLALTGTVQAVDRATLKAKVAGEVREITVREGDRVKAGQTVVRMETREYQARLDQALGTLAAARGQLDIARTSRDNNRALLDKGFISRNAFETAANQYAIARANVDSAKAAVDVVRESFRDTTLRAPIDGTISRRAVQPGEKVSPDNALLDIVDLRQLELAAPVPAADIPNVAVGQDVDVVVEGLPERLHARIVRINPAAEAGSRSVLVYIRLDNPGEALRSGMFAQAELTIARREAVPAVPQAAIHRQGGQSFVYAVRDGRIARQPVELGASGVTADGPAVEVSAGIVAGDRIVRNNLGALPLGAAVQIVPGNGTAAASGGTPASAASAASAVHR